MVERMNNRRLIMPSNEQIVEAAGLARREEVIALGQGALCNMENASLFESEEPEHVAAAKSLCIKCPWVVQCLANALAEEHGDTRGATTPRERKLIRKRYAVKPSDASQKYKGIMPNDIQIMQARKATERSAQEDSGSEENPDKLL